MPIKELEDLLGTVTDAADRAMLETILERNPETQRLTIEQRELYRALVDGDSAAIGRIEQREAAARAAAAARTQTATSATTTQQPSSVAFDLAQLEAAVTRTMMEKFRPQLETQQSYIEEVATRAAQAVADKLGPQLLAQATNTADSIYSIRSSHQAEFGEPLDTTKFTEYLDAPENKNRYASLAAAHDAFVQQRRIDKKIADGVAAGVAARDTTEVPGTTLAGSDSMAARFVAKNAAAGGTARGEGLDAATKAFRELRRSHVE